MLQAHDHSEALRLLDHLLLEQRAFDPFEFLLAAGWLRFTDYEAWRLGHTPELLALLRNEPALKAPELAALLDNLHGYAGAQGLVAQRQPLERWGSERGPLRIGGGTGQAHLGELLSTRRELDPGRAQLDLFHDSGATLLEDRLREALCTRRAEAAADVLAQLREQRPEAARLDDWQTLVEAPNALSTLPDPSARWQALERIDKHARRLLGSRARDYLAPLWTALAQSLEPAFTQANTTGDSIRTRMRPHPAAAWARAAHWPHARTSIEATPDWPSEPELRTLHACACWQERDPQAARSDWLQLCWEHPDQAAPVLRAKDFPDPALTNAWQCFEDSDAELDTEDFPAWLLLTSPGLIPATPELAPTDPDLAEVFAAARALQANPDQITRREALDALHAGLLRAFLAIRDDHSGRRA